MPLNILLSAKMGFNGDKWIRIFDIPDVSKHRKGFTIYKVISMLYPETCPDAVTKVTVWKRFNDFKKLHREVKVLHKRLNLKDKYPSLPNSSFFKRFDEEVVQDRRQSILNFLEYVGFQSQLYTSKEFVKFFESSHTPVEQLNSNINLIRADLNLPEEEFYALNSDDEPTISDTDSVTTLNSLSPSLQTNDIPEFMSHSISSFSKSKLSLNSSMTASQHSRTSDSISVSDSITLLDGQIYPTPPDTPGCGDGYVQYIIDASIHVNMAVELESEKKYEEAFTAYKIAIDILIKNGKDDKNYDRQQIVRYKTEKYLIRAERIFNLHLSPEMKSLRQITECPEEVQEPFVQRPISDLYKYKVVKVIASGMLVLHSELQQLFYIKVIHKTMKFLSENLVLPENVPYMVKLYNYYNCENALFLVLEYCCGMRLWDYIKHRSENPDDVFYGDGAAIARDFHDLELISSDQESEHSYSDLISEYASNKARGTKTSSSSVREGDVISSDGSYEKIDGVDLFDNRNLMDRPIDGDFRAKCVVSNNGNNVNGNIGIEAEGRSCAGATRRKVSEMSSFDEVEVVQNFHVPARDVAKWAAQLLLALEKLHTLGIICRDIRAKNLLIGENGDLALTYMCNASDLCDAFSAGKSGDLAPEIYGFQAITEAVDWWCYGAILYELLVGMPLSSVHPDGLSSYTSLRIPKYVSPEGRSLLKQLLVFEPRDRLGAGINGTENLKSHPYFQAISWDSLSAKYY